MILSECVIILIQFFAFASHDHIKVEYLISKILYTQQLKQSVSVLSKYQYFQVQNFKTAIINFLKT